VPVGIAHVGLDTGGQAVSDHADDAEQQAQPHASGAEDERGEENPDGGGEEHRNRAASRTGGVAGHLLLGYIKVIGR